jgi:HSP20 family molecular chaperone IbpA
MAADSNDRRDHSIIGGLEMLIDQLGSWAEDNHKMHRTVEFGEGDSQAVFSVRMRTGIGGDPRSAPSSRSAASSRTERASDRSRAPNPSRAPNSSRAATQVDVRRSHTPVAEVFDEGDRLRVVAEMPGVGSKDIRVAVKGDVLSLQAESPSHRYDTEVLLPVEAHPDPASIGVRNGVVEIVVEKQDDGE